MVLEKLSASLKGTLQKIAGALFVDEKLLNELVKDIQKAFLQADVNVSLVFELTKKIKERALKAELSSAGHRKSEPAIIMLIGLFGSGKTTTAGKLAKYFLKRGKKVALVGLDIHRPAAMDQLEQVGKAINVPVFIDK